MLNDLGFAIVNPVALDLLTRSAPQGLESRMASLFYLQFAFDSFLAGGLGHLFGQMPTKLFWLMHTLLFAMAGAIVLIAGGWILRAMEPLRPPPRTERSRPLNSAPEIATA